MGETESIDTLLDAGADIEARTEDGLTPLQMAALDGQTQAITALLDAGAILTFVLKADGQHCTRQLLLGMLKLSKFYLRRRRYRS